MPAAPFGRALVAVVGRSGTGRESVMTWQAWATVGVVVGAVGLLACTRAGPVLVLLGAVTLLLTAGVLKPAEALTGFANEATVTVGVLFVVAAGVRDTGALALLAQRLLGRPQSVRGAQARLMFPVAAISTVLYKTPLVAIMLPVVDEWARKNRIAPSKLMIPLSYAAMLGGMCTLIGTSSNLVVNGLLVSQAGLPGLRLFDATWVGLPCALAGLAYLVLFGRRLLPDRRPALRGNGDARRYTAEMLVTPGSPLVGQTIESAGLRHLPGLYLVEIGRQGEVLPAVAPHERLCGDDRLVFVGIVESVVDLQKIRGLKPATDQVFKLDGPRSDRCLVEAVVSNSCPLVGKTIREGRFRTVYNAAVIAVARDGERLYKKVGDIELRAGDTLLLETHPSFLDQHRNSRDFFLVSRVENSAPPPHDRAWVAGAILLGMVVAGGAGWLSMLNAALLAAGLMVLTRCCSPASARQGVDWQVLLVIASSFGLGQAMHASGAAAAIAHALMGLAGGRPWVALGFVYAVTVVFTEFMSHSAAAVLVFPIALAAAAALRVSFLPFAIAIMVAASCGFATPIGYQTNLMVYGPGGYRFGDYVRFGAPLDVLVGAVAVLLTPLVWPF